MNRISALHAVLVLVAFSVLAVAALQPLSTTPMTRIYDGSAFPEPFLNQPDVTLHAWILAWDTHKLVAGGWSTWFDANIFHPARRALTHSDHMLGVLPFFAPLFLLSHQLALSFNLWVLATFAMSGASAYLVVFLWTRSRSAALLSGVAFALAPWRFYELSHPQLLSVQFLPVIAYLCSSGTTRFGWKRVALLAVIIALQGTSSAYLGYLGFLVASLCLGARFVAGGYSPAVISRPLVGLLVGAIPIVLLSLPYLSLQDAGAIVPKIEARDTGWALLRIYLFPPAQSHEWTVWWLVPVLGLVGAFLGLRHVEQRARTAALVACAILSSLFAVSQARHVWGLPVGSLDDAAGWLIPGWSALRVMNRFGIVGWLAASLLCAVPFSRERPWLPPRVRGPIAIGLAVLLAASSISFEIRTRDAPEVVRDPAPYAWLAENGEGAPLVEWPARLGISHSEAQYMSHRHWIPMVNGYSGYTPPWNELMKSLADVLHDPDAFRTFTTIGWARWLLVHRPSKLPGSPSWERLTEIGARQVLAGEDYLLFELPYGESSAIDEILDPSAGRTLLGTPIEDLALRDLDAIVEPVHRQIRGPLGLGPHLPFEIQNGSQRAWPGVAASRDGLVGLELRARRPGSSAPGAALGFFRLPTDLQPGSRSTVWARPTGILEPGTWDLVPCILQWGSDVERCYESGRVRLDVPEASGG